MIYYCCYFLHNRNFADSLKKAHNFVYDGSWFSQTLLLHFDRNNNFIYNNIILQASTMKSVTLLYLKDNSRKIMIFTESVAIRYSHQLDVLPRSGSNFNFIH